MFRVFPTPGRLYGYALPVVVLPRRQALPLLASAQRAATTATALSRVSKPQGRTTSGLQMYMQYNRLPLRQPVHPAAGVETGNEPTQQQGAHCAHDIYTGALLKGIPRSCLFGRTHNHPFKHTTVLQRKATTGHPLKGHDVPNGTQQQFAAPEHTAANTKVRRCCMQVNNCNSTSLST